MRRPPEFPLSWLTLTRYATATVFLLLASLVVMGCGRSDVAPPVTEQEVEELELDFDAGIDAPQEAPAGAADSSEGTP